jgi:NADPH:quinone reductase-like Zn-dependent oxidoreductase
MKAIVAEKYGTPDVFELRDVPTPQPGDEEVLVKVCAVSINDWDWGLLQGSTLFDRLISGLFKPRHPILGSDIAGRVVAVGGKVTHFRVGDEVYGDLSGKWGGFAEYVCAAETALALKPPAMTFEQAAAIPQAAMLAVQGLRDIGRMQPGQKLLVNGAGGGVGCFAVQIAKQYGLEVTGVDSAGKLDAMRELGFDKVIDYTKEDFTQGGIAYDMILDAKTSRPMADHARVLKPGGAYVTVGGDTGCLLRLALFGGLFARLHGKSMRLVMLKPNQELAFMNEQFKAGKLKLVIEHFRSLAEIPAAMRHYASGKHQGKVVITLE